jgi:hypothetical protein
MTQSDIRKMLNDLDTSNADREALKQKCHELENHVNLLQDAKANISAEFEQLQSQVWYFLEHSVSTGIILLRQGTPERDKYILYNICLQLQVIGKGMLKTEEFGGGGNGGGNQQTKQLKRQLEATQEDLYKMEKVKTVFL